MRLRILTALAALGAALGAPAQAQEEAIKAELQCVAFSLYAAGDKDKDISAFGSFAAYFYLGRLQGRLTDQATSEALATFLSATSEEELVAQGDRCVEEFERAADVFSGLSAAAETDQKK